MMGFFYGKNAVHVYNMIGMPHDAIEFLLHVTFKGGGDIDMMAGDVQVEVAAASVKTAHVDANFGDVSLVTTGDAHEGPRRLLVGAEMDWQEGSGDCALAVDLTFGDVTVTLN